MQNINDPVAKGKYDLSDRYSNKIQKETKRKTKPKEVDPKSNNRI